MGGCNSKEPMEEDGDVFHDVDEVDGGAKKLRRTKSMVNDGGAQMRRTKSAVYEKQLPEEEAKDLMLRRTSNKALEPMDSDTASPTPTDDKKEQQPSIEVGLFTHVGDPDVHPNEDRATAVLDLLGKYAPPATQYQGTTNKQVFFCGVYDGHGGSICSEFLRKNLHINVAKELYTQNYHENMKDVLVKVFEETEDTQCTKHAPGSCCVTVMIKGRKVYCADAGDSMAVIYQEVNGKMQMTKLNDRHGVEFSKHEIVRLKAAKAEISEDYETEGAVIARDSRGYFIKALYPTRGFGDADFKELVAPKPVVVATPTGRGVGYEGPAVELKGKGPFWLLVGCDGLWDFMKEDQITKTMFQKNTPQAMAEHLTRVAQGHPYSSYDDVTCVVCKIEYK
eukprot:m.164202 g.164202  ORF g.164202 m.164202 type:complete len:393 (+) comp31325_c1_seq4:284-1462(+)